MTLTPYTIEEFGGIDLLRSPEQIGATGATAISNVALDTPGKLRTRDGYSSLATTTTAPTRVHWHQTESAVFVVSSSSTKLEAFTSGGASVASVTPGAGPHAMTSYGTATASPAVYATTTSDASFRKFNGTAWSTVAGAPVGIALAVTGNSNRLVVAGTNGGDRVQFSDPGAPETFTSTSWVDLRPGDGEFITAACSWQGKVFVFKPSTLFVFGDESVDVDGSPVFNYYAVESSGARQARQPVAVAPHGVYFLNQDGIWLTTGGQPVLVSKPLAPLFGGIANAGASTWGFSLGTYMAWHKGRLIVNFGTSGGGVDSRVFVWYQNTDSWSEWDVFDGKNGGQITGHPRAANLVFVNGTDSAIYSMSPSDTTDAGAAIPWSYTSGRYSLSDPGRVVCTQESSAVGSGTIGMSVTTDLYGTLAGPGATLGTLPATAEGWPMTDQEGTWFQHTLSGSGVAQINRLTHDVSFVKPAGVR